MFKFFFHKIYHATFKGKISGSALKWVKKLSLGNCFQILGKARQFTLHPIRWRRWLSLSSDWLKRVEKLESGIVKGKVGIPKTKNRHP